MSVSSRELVRAIIALEKVPRCGFWLGNPHADTWPLLHRYFGTRNEDELRLKLGDDLCWFTPQYLPSTYRHPEGKGLFDIWKTKESLGQVGPLAGCRTIAEIEGYDWPNPDYLHFSESLEALNRVGDRYCASGFWAPFFHDAVDLMGMEDFLTGMNERPDLVEAVLGRVCGFYLEANSRFFAQAGERVDALFFGNDFGTQRDLLFSPDQFKRFLLPWMRRFTDQAREHGYQVVLHSCGSIRRVIPLLIEAGIQCLHPLQSRAAGMDADTLAREFKGRIAFMGGIDTQEVLVNAKPSEVRREVKRVMGLLGPHLVVSPSHEALLPNVPPANVAAMAEAAKE